MSATGASLGAAAEAFGWGTVLDIMRNLPPGSATWRAQHPDEAAYASPYHVALMLADIYDAVAAVAVAVVRSAGGKAKKADLYPRPGKRDKGNTRRLGSGAIPVAEFDAWYYGRSE